MHVFGYVCKICHKEFAIFLTFSTTCNFNKTFPLPQVFSCHFKTKYFLEHLQMGVSGNVTKYAVSYQYEQCDGILVCNSIFE